METDTNSLFIRLKNNADLYYLIVTILTTSILLFIDHETAFSVGGMLALLGILLLPLTLGAKIFGFSADERANKVLLQSANMAFPVTIGTTAMLSLLSRYGLVSWQYDITSIIVFVGYFTENVCICIIRRSI